MDHLQRWIPYTYSHMSPGRVVFSARASEPVCRGFDSASEWAVHNTQPDSESTQRYLASSIGQVKAGLIVELATLLYC